MVANLFAILIQAKDYCESFVHFNWPDHLGNLWFGKRPNANFSQTRTPRSTLGTICVDADPDPSRPRYCLNLRLSDLDRCVWLVCKKHVWIFDVLSLYVVAIHRRTFEPCETVFDTGSEFQNSEPDPL